MEFVKFGILAAVLMVGVFWISRLLTSTSRNRGGTHGGGQEGISDGVDLID